MTAYQLGGQDKTSGLTLCKITHKQLNMHQHECREITGDIYHSKNNIKHLPWFQMEMVKPQKFNNNNRWGV